MELYVLSLFVMRIFSPFFAIYKQRAFQKSAFALNFEFLVSAPNPPLSKTLPLYRQKAVKNLCWIKKNVKFYHHRKLNSQHLPQIYACDEKNGFFKAEICAFYAKTFRPIHERNITLKATRHIAKASKQHSAILPNCALGTRYQPSA